MASHSLAKLYPFCCFSEGTSSPYAFRLLLKMASHSLAKLYPFCCFSEGTSSPYALFVSLINTCLRRSLSRLRSHCPALFTQYLFPLKLLLLLLYSHVILLLVRLYDDGWLPVCRFDCSHLLRFPYNILLQQGK